MILCRVNDLFKPLQTIFLNTTLRLYDLSNRCASIRSVNIPVVSLHEDDIYLIKAIIQQSLLAVVEDGAHAIVLGCTGMGGKFAREVELGLDESGISGVPVIDPTGIALKMAENLVALDLCHSKRTFPTPPAKKIKGYEDLEIQSHA